MMNELTFKKALKPRSLAIGILCSAITTVAFSEVSVNESYFQIEQNIDRSIVEGFNREVNILELPMGNAQSFSKLERYDEKVPLNEMGQVYQREEQYLNRIELPLSEINTLKLKAVNGDQISQFYLGSLYENGKGVDQDYMKAIENYKLAADQGDTLSMLRLGNMYDSGRGIRQDKEMADQYYNESIVNIDNEISEFFDNATLGDSLQNEVAFMGFMESFGVIVKSFQMIPKIFNYLTPRYHVAQGEFFFKRKGVSRGFEKAFKSYNLAMKDRASDIGIDLNYNDSINALVENNSFKNMSVNDAIENREKVKLWFHETCFTYQDKVSCSLLNIMDYSDLYLKTDQPDLTDNSVEKVSIQFDKSSTPYLIDTSDLYLEKTQSDSKNNSAKNTSTPFVSSPIEILTKPNPSLRIDTIKGLYSDTFNKFQKTNDSSYDAKTLYNYAHEDLKDVIFLAQNASVMNDNNKEAECHKAIQRLHLLDSNGRSPEDVFDFIELRNEDVRVLTALEGGSSGLKEYSLQCTDNNCEITDIFDQYGVSAIKSIGKACR